MKKKNKYFLYGGIIVAVLALGLFIFKNNDKKELTYNDLVNISDLSEEFMQDYFEDVQELQDNGNSKDNILIVTSAEKIKDTYGAVDVIEAPNHQYILQYDSEEKKDKALANLKDDDRILGAEENIVYTIEETDYNSWGINSMVLDTAIEVANEKDLDEVVVAILDTGCDVPLANKYYNGKIKETYNVLSKSTNVDDMVDTNGHGTHVFGTIAEGTPNNVKIIPIKISTDGRIYNTDIIAAINYVTYYEKADVMNMSFGGYNYSQAEEQAINAANAKNIISVAAAGNDNSSGKHYPSAFENTISIASVDSNLNKSSFSNWGSQITFTAPGTAIKSIMSSEAEISGNTDGDDDHETISGTSMATPHAVSAVAILKSYNKDLTYNNVVDLLKRTAIDLGATGWDRNFGYGLISFATAEFCDGVDCDEYNVFKKDLEELTIKKIEAPDSITSLMNYGNITNILNANLRIYYTNTAYYTKQLWELDDLEITGYDPYSYTIQEVNVNYDGKTTTLTVDNRGSGSSGWEYESIDENNIRLTELKTSPLGSAPKRIYIPSEYDGYTVKEIGQQLFYNKSSIKYVILPNTITKINNNAFRGSGIIRVDAPSIEIDIGDYAFSDMESLTSFSGIVKSMGSHAFFNSQQLDNITLSENITQISNGAFHNDVNLEHINIPDSITYIGPNAFNYTNIKSIVIPDGITTIEDYAFSNCLNLESVTLPESLTEIGRYAFTYTNIRELYIPKNVVSISEDAFSYISSLETIEVDEDNTVYDSRDDCNAIITTATNTVFRASNNTEIPLTVTKIGNYSYSGSKRDNLTLFEVPNHITEIGDYAFYETNYNPIKIPRSVISMGSYSLGSRSTTVYVYSDSYAKTYVTDNSYNYKHIDPTSVLVSLPKKQYTAFETVDTTDMYIVLRYEETKTRNEFYTDPQEFTIVYNNNNDSFRYGDTSFTVSLYSNANEYIEKQVSVTISKAVPDYNIPNNLVAETGQTLSAVILPDGFEWMNPTQEITEAGNQSFKARYTPSDTNNYEIVENIDIPISVSKTKSVVIPNIQISNKTYDGTTNIDLNSITISNLNNEEYTIQSATLSSSNVGNTTATIVLRLSDNKFIDYMFEDESQEKEFTVNVEIVPQELTKPTKVEKTYTYNGEEQTIEINNFDSNKMNITGNTRTNAGEQNVVISLKNSNYIWSDNSTEDIIFNFTITKADINVVDNTQNASYTYDNAPHTITLNLNDDNFIVKYMDSNEEYTLDECPEYTDVGVYSIKYKVYLNDNYNVYYGERTLTISRIKYTVTFFANDGTESSVTQEMEDSVDTALRKNTFTKDNYLFKEWNTKADGKGTSYEDERVIAISSNLNLYAIWEENYGTITNNSTDYEGIYDGNNHSINISVNPPNYTIKYSINNTNYDLTELPTFKEVGEYTVNYKISADGYNDLEGSNKVKIYGIKNFDSSITLKDDKLVIQENSFNSISNKITTYSTLSEYKHYNKDNELVTTDTLKTGDIIKVILNGTKTYEYRISFLGDTSGDGKINYLDYVNVYNHIQKVKHPELNKKLLADEYLLAADMSGDNKISYLDYVRIYNKIKELKGGNN